MKAAEQSNGWWLITDEKDIIEGPFGSYQDLCDFYIRMDYQYE